MLVLASLAPAEATVGDNRGDWGTEYWAIIRDMALKLPYRRVQPSLGAILEANTRATLDFLSVKIMTRVSNGDGYGDF